MELNELEKDLIKALKTTAFGREGLIFKGMIKDKSIVKSLIDKGIVKEIEHFETYSSLPNQSHIGLVGEEYPQTSEEFSDYRDSGYSEKVSFSEFKKLIKQDKVEWTSSKLNEILSDVQDVFEEKFEKKKGYFWLNLYKNKFDLLDIKSYIREGHSKLEILEFALTTNMDIDEFERIEGDHITIKDKKWFDGILEKAIEHKQRQNEKG